ncbi:MAG: putative cytokinetic ring protein SteA [Bacillota bacterium]|nr:putative cytokinetic ring protein SteA [Bacillota bacterium]
MRVTGRIRVDRRTKNLARRLRKSEIAVIDHCDLDEVAARSLLERGVRAVLNASPCFSGGYPARGTPLLVEQGVPVVDSLGSELMDRLREGDRVEVVDGRVYLGGQELAEGRVVDQEVVARELERSYRHLRDEWDAFLENTLSYAQREKELILEPFPVPPLRTRLRGRPALVVTRGPHYKEDLEACLAYIRHEKPVLIGVDGGADALREFGLMPDLVVGDMDSVEDETLRRVPERVVHAYPDGCSPGLERVRRMGLEAHVIPAHGTSEDVALLMTYEAGASLIVAVGTHTGMIDFLEKGRRGMASTFLARLKAADRLVDAKGLSQVYRPPRQFAGLWQLVLAGLLPLAIIFSISPPLRSLLTLWWLNLRVAAGL